MWRVSDISYEGTNKSSLNRVEKIKQTFFKLYMFILHLFVFFQRNRHLFRYIFEVDKFTLKNSLPNRHFGVSKVHH